MNHKGAHLCSATLLNTQYDKLAAITAASCLPTNDAKEYTLTFGKAKATGEDGDEYCILKKIKLFEDFDKQKLNNDVALLFSEDVTDTGNCDAFINKTSLGVVIGNITTSYLQVRVTGWDDKSSTLKVIENEAGSNSETCNNQLLTAKNLDIGPTMLCHGVPSKDGVPEKCRAERGSPVVFVQPEATPVLVAVTSWTIVSLFYQNVLQHWYIANISMFFFNKQSPPDDDDTWYPCVGTRVTDDSIKKWIEGEIDEYASR